LPSWVDLVPQVALCRNLAGLEVRHLAVAELSVVAAAVPTALASFAGSFLRHPAALHNGPSCVVAYHAAHSTLACEDGARPCGDEEEGLAACTGARGRPFAYWGGNLDSCCWADRVRLFLPAVDSMIAFAAAAVQVDLYCAGGGEDYAVIVAEGVVE
jgi:hypothetical protein